MHQLSASFERKLKNVDSNLRALYDDVEDAIFVYALRQGLKVHELTSKRQYAENYEELENRTVAKLQSCDVWKKFGNGKVYDDFLDEEEKKERAAKKKEARDKRLAWFKENRELVKAAVWNAQHGRTDASTALPFQTAQFSMSDIKPERKDGYTVVDKRQIKPELQTSPEGQGVI